MKIFTTIAIASTVLLSSCGGANAPELPAATDTVVVVADTTPIPAPVVDTTKVDTLAVDTAN